MQERISDMLSLVCKGGDQGLSKLVSETAFIRRRGIIPKALKPLACLPNPPAGEELVVSGMQEIISKMLNHADGFIFLPIYLVTLEALITFTSWAHLNIH